MPVFVPTLPQGQGPLQPIRTPQVNSNLPGPLRVDIPIGVIQRNRGLDQNEILNQIRLDQLNLAKSKFTFEVLDNVLNSFNQDFLNQYGQSQKQRRSVNQGSFNVDPSIFPNLPGEVNQIMSDGQERLAGLAQSLGNDSSASGEFITEALSIKTDVNSKLRDTTRLREALALQRQLDGLEDKIFIKVQDGLNFAVIKGAFDDLRGEIANNFSNNIPTRPNRFELSNFVIDKKAGINILDNNLEEVLIGSEFVDVLTSEQDARVPRGMVLRENVKIQRAREDIIKRISPSLKNDPNFMGLVLNRMSASGETEDEAMIGMIDARLAIIALDSEPGKTTFSSTVGTLEKLPAVTTDGVESKFTGTQRGQIEFGRDRLERMGLNPDLYADADLIGIGEADNLEIDNAGEITLKGGDLDEHVIVPSTAEIEEFRKEFSKEFDFKEFTEKGLRNVPEELRGGETLLDKVKRTLNISLKEGVTLDGLADNALNVLANIPDRFNKEEGFLTGGFRTQEENEFVGSKDTSAHRTGEALDFRTKSKAGREFAEWVTGTEEGKKWLVDQGYNAIWEDIGGENEHLHLEPIASKLSVQERLRRNASN